MNLKGETKLTGHIKFDLYAKDGSLKDTREVKNVVVTVGKNYLAAWLIAATQADYFMRYIALGQGVTPATAADTALDSTLATRVAGTLSSATNVWQNQATFGPGVNTGAITESGIFSLSSGGTMLARQVFAVINKDSSDSLQVTWQITLS
jgi:hypothetical protein